MSQRFNFVRYEPQESNLMTLGSRVYDSSAPGRIGVFNGFRQSFGRKMAVVKFPGKPPTQIPAERVAPVVPKQKTGPKPKLKRLTPDKYAVLLHEHGITPEEAHRRALATGSTLEDVYAAFAECEEGCECDACGDNS